MMALPKRFITPKELLDAINDPKPQARVVVVCASWYPPEDYHSSREAADTFRQIRIPGARFFDVDLIKGKLPMKPTTDEFCKAMQTLGIKKDDVVVTYETMDRSCPVASEVAWIFRCMNHEKVLTLNNFMSWMDADYPVEEGEPRPVEPSIYS